MSAYVVSLLCVIGINMILALSLNIITGFWSPARWRPASSAPWSG